MSDARSGVGGQGKINHRENTRLPRDENGQAQVPLVGVLTIRSQEAQSPGLQMAAALVSEGWAHRLTLLP